MLEKEYEISRKESESDIVDYFGGFAQRAEIFPLLYPMKSVVVHHDSISDQGSRAIVGGGEEGPRPPLTVSVIEVVCGAVPVSD